MLMKRGAIGRESLTNCLHPVASRIDAQNRRESIACIQTTRAPTVFFERIKDEQGDEKGRASERVGGCWCCWRCDAGEMLLMHDEETRFFLGVEWDEIRRGRMYMTYDRKDVCGDVVMEHY